MGITIEGTHKNSLSLTGSYNMMALIRNEVSKAWDKEFGEHYATLGKCNSDKDYEIFNDKANKIINSERLIKQTEDDSDILDFLFAPDCEGKLHYNTCMKIYNLIKDLDLTYPLQYLAYSKDDWNIFKQLLQDCFNKKRNLIWY